MKNDPTLTIVSLLAMLFAIIHLCHDMALGFAPGGLSNIPVVLVLAIWLYTTLELAGRPTGYIVNLVLSLFLCAIPVLHMMGRRGITAGIAEPAGALFFAFTCLAVGALAVLSVLLTVRRLVSSRAR